MEKFVPLQERYDALELELENTQAELRGVRKALEVYDRDKVLLMNQLRSLKLQNEKLVNQLSLIRYHLSVSNSIINE